MLDLRDQIRGYFDAIDPPLDVEALLDTEIPTDLVAVPPRRITTPRRGLLIAAGVAVGVMVAVGIAAWLLRSAGEESPPVTQPPPTVPQTDDDAAGLLGFRLSDVPPYRATVIYRSSRGGEALLEISYAGDAGGFRMDIVEITPSEEPPSFGEFGSSTVGSGSYYIWSRTGEEALFKADERTVMRAEGYDAFDIGSDPGQFAAAASQWGERCGEGLNLLGAELTVLEPESIAGRPATHVRCTLLDDTWELWVDEATGVILQATGLLEGLPFPAADGFYFEDEFEIEVAVTFETIAIEYGPVFEENTFELIAPPGWTDPIGEKAAAIAAIPPFYARVRMFNDEANWMIFELWYAGRDGFRMEVIENQGDVFAPVGTLEVWTGSRWGAYYAGEGFFTSDVYFKILDGFPITAAAESDFTEGLCEPVGSTERLGRTVEHYVCPEDEIWVDIAAGLILERAARFESHEILELDLDPTFPEGLFVFDPPPDAVTELESGDRGEGFEHRTVGQPAPPLAGDLVEGGTFDLNDVLGRPAVVVFWYSDCPPCLDHLDVLEGVAPGRPDIVFVTGLIEDTAAEARPVIAEQGYSIPALDVPAARSYQDEGIILGVPTTVFVSPDGTIAAVFFGRILNPDAYDAIFTQAGW
jgi:peroxiredoxin